MNNILTIDFDIIMKPSIQLYNDLIGDSKSINKVLRQYPSLEYCLSSDLNIYEYLTRFIILNIKKMNKNSVHFIREHNTAIPIIEKYDECVLYNIDHHHDLGYNITASTKIFKPDCGNWVKYLMDKQKVKKYIWIHNDNSNMPSSTLFEMKYINTKIELSNFSPLEYLTENMDELIICNSPQWIPNSLQPLFMTWMTICEEYYQTNYTFED